MEIDVQQYLQLLKDKLLAAPQQFIACAKGWRKPFPQKAGAYVIRQSSRLVYIGETGNIKERMGDIVRTCNHTLRRTLGAEMYDGHPGYKKATSKERFCDEIEVLLNDFMSTQLTVAFLEIELGRAELEDFIIRTELPVYNIKKPRKIN
ncbi:GIY-YIG nuclease family protein [Chitinophaga arvensicola]|uniref:GIY-YIG catalytic domain-containing protein n=1 Tax=Chitinophaga arvensicola TaxID=29529 RepID=A0A1I0PSG2_9BACT|nr:hypothetical protein [Chitinophaga arvensicola]SEW16842.1 hypothetical protein SAMN04488122_0925 [Chitinophaga arvensicola]